MTRQVVVSDAAYAALCEMAAVVKEATGRVPSFADLLDSLMEGLSAA